MIETTIRGQITKEKCIIVLVAHGSLSVAQCSLSGKTYNLADAAAGKIKLWQVLGTGVDHFPLAYWNQLHIPVDNTPGQFSSVALAECAMMFILMLTRRYAVAKSGLAQGVFYEPLGQELTGLRLGIIGFGASGQELARRAAAFGVGVSSPQELAQRRQQGCTLHGYGSDYSLLVNAARRGVNAFRQLKNP